MNAKRVYLPTFFLTILIAVCACTTPVSIGRIAQVLGITKDLIKVTGDIAELTTKYGTREFLPRGFISDHKIDMNDEAKAIQRVKQLDEDMQDSIVECSYRAIEGDNSYHERVKCLEVIGRWNSNDIIYMVCKHDI